MEAPWGCTLAQVTAAPERLLFLIVNHIQTLKTFKARCQTDQSMNFSAVLSVVTEVAVMVMVKTHQNTLVCFAPVLIESMIFLRA